MSTYKLATSSSARCRRAVMCAATINGRRRCRDCVRLSGDAPFLPTKSVFAWTDATAPRAIGEIPPSPALFSQASEWGRWGDCLGWNELAREDFSRHCDQRGQLSGVCAGATRLLRAIYRSEISETGCVAATWCSFSQIKI